jgi:signal transduction histidine kinase
MQRRTLESDIHTDAEKLQQLVSELQDQKVEEQMSKTRGDIYASIIHDLNGPLTVISGFVQLMNQRIGDATRLGVEDLEFIKQRLGTITRQVANCVQISQRYLGFLRQQNDEAQRVGVNELLNDLSHLIRVHPSLQQNEFSIRPLAQDVAVRMNGTDLIQAVLNLAVNAFQCSSEPHSVTIEGRVLSEPLDLTVFKDTPQERLINMEGFANAAPLLALAVRDTGPGIPPEILPKVFQPYFTTKGSRQGTGLGLNIVHRLIKEAKGALHVRTERGKGTVFSIYLPALPLEPKPV